ncbi:MAG: hypothetical protein FWE42_06970, partial [Defluviitaleaceae bacterium]|nr:hypothetical protein [Defluviitaleaceae bacterium]
VTSQGSADDAGQEGPLEGADAGLWQKDRNGFNFLAEISMNSRKCENIDLLCRQLACRRYMFSHFRIAKPFSLFCFAHRIN